MNCIGVVIIKSQIPQVKKGSEGIGTHVTIETPAASVNIAITRNAARKSTPDKAMATLLFILFNSFSGDSNFLTHSSLQK